MMNRLLRQVREGLGMTETEVARRASISLALVSLLEIGGGGPAGHRQDPTRPIPRVRGGRAHTTAHPCRRCLARSGRRQSALEELQASRNANVSV